MSRSEDKKQQQQDQPTDNQRTDAQSTTPLSERISETGMDQLEEKTQRYTHTNESENKEGTPWSPGQASS
jgi:hypothetical protein